MTRIQGVPDLGPGLRLHLNENTGGCSPKVVEAVRAFDAPSGWRLYPDYRAAVVETAAFLGVDPDWLVLTNGLDEGVLLAAIAYLVPRAPRALVELGAPDVRRPGCRGRRAAAGVRDLPHDREGAGRARRLGAAGARLRLSGRRDAARRHAATRGSIYINNPNNPTGPAGAAGRHPARRARGRRTRSCSWTRRITTSWARTSSTRRATYPNVLVGRTFSKAHGLAGMRVGVMIAPPAVLEPIRSCMPLFNLNVVAVAALRAALTDRDVHAVVRRAGDASRRRCSTTPAIGSACATGRARRTSCWSTAATARASSSTGMIARGVLVRDRSKDPYCRQLLPHHGRRRRAHARRPSRRWRRCAQGGNRARAPRETQIRVALNLDGSGRFDNHTGIRFLDHMLELVARHGALRSRRCRPTAISTSISTTPSRTSASRSARRWPRRSATRAASTAPATS